MKKISLDTANLGELVTDKDIVSVQAAATKHHDALEAGKCAGSEWTGWLHLPSSTREEEVKKITAAAAEIRDQSDIFITIAVGGSYLGARAATGFLSHTYSNTLSPGTAGGPGMYFAGTDLSSDALSDLLDVLEDKTFSINVISKSGTTLEPALAFRVLKKALEDRCGKKEATKRIFITTDEKSGALRKLAGDQGYKSFVVPGNVGGRYSVLTPVGLLPMAVAGININELLEGARSAERATGDPSVETNPAYRYAVARNLLYKGGKRIEVLSTFHPSLHFVAEWWKQLAGESEGKDGVGIFPASVDLTTDLHSMGQLIQDGERNLFETFLTVEKSRKEVLLPQTENNDDGLNYLAGKPMDFVSDKAQRGTAAAHKDGGVPNMTIRVADRSAFALGELFYFFERAVAMSGLLLRVNPFDQPGVELYKRNMLKLLGKDG